MGRRACRPAAQDVKSRICVALSIRAFAGEDHILEHGLPREIAQAGELINGHRTCLDSRTTRNTQIPGLGSEARKRGTGVATVG